MKREIIVAKSKLEQLKEDLKLEKEELKEDVLVYGKHSKIVASQKELVKIVEREIVAAKKRIKELLKKERKSQEQKNVFLMK